MLSDADYLQSFSHNLNTVIHAALVLKPHDARLFIADGCAHFDKLPAFNARTSNFVPSLTDDAYAIGQRLPEMMDAALGHVLSLRPRPDDPLGALSRFLMAGIEDLAT